MAERERSRLPVLFADRPTGVQLLLVLVVPLVFGVICGAVLGPVVVVYLVLQLVAAIGGIIGGLEHRRTSEATVRGLAAGLTFGLAILGTHVLLHGDDHQLLGQDPLLLPWLTGLFGAFFAVLGSFLRRWLERRMASKAAG
ncbi:MAG: hypothetical protein WBD38_02230 [Candidatus Dormiibacterota bacterium]